MQLLRNFKMALFEQGISQRELARKTGIPESYLSMAVHGKFNLTDDQKVKITSALSMPKERLF